VYSIPLAVKANVGVPLGIVIAPSDRKEVFSIFADALVEKGFSLGDLFELPPLSDAGTALRSYTDVGVRRRGYHRRHYLCYRHLLESLGSNTLVSLLARRLLFTRTQDAFRELFPQSVADFELGCQQNLISDAGRAKFGKLFGVDLTQSDGNECATTNSDVFREQALWGERGITFGVAASSNHIEGMHGRLNAKIRNFRNFRARFVEIASAVIKSASNWSKKVERGWQATKTKLERNAKDKGFEFQDCPNSAYCDKGLLLSRRLGRQGPRVHTISKCTWENQPPPAQFSVTTRAPPDISFTEFKGTWTLEVGQEGPKIGQVEDEMEGDASRATMSPDVRSVVRIRREVTALNTNHKFRYSLEDMFIRFGEVHAELRITHRSNLTEAQIKQRANSIFLLDCAHVAQTKGEWPRH
jgi:hypothetical protein